MVAGGLESVLIGDPVDGVGHSIVFERVGSLSNGATFIPDLFLGASLFNFDLILSFVPVKSRQSKQFNLYRVTTESNLSLQDFISSGSLDHH